MFVRKNKFVLIRQLIESKKVIKTNVLKNTILRNKLRVNELVVHLIPEIVSEPKSVQ
jgi:hypothetical protein